MWNTFAPAGVMADMHLQAGGALAPLLVVTLLVACGQGGGTTPPVAFTGEPVLAVVEGGDEPTGDGLTVAEAIEHQPTDDIVSVSGFLLVDVDGSVRLCDAILESFPPQCGGASLLVENLDLEAIDLEEAHGVRWAEGVTLLGSVE